MKRSNTRGAAATAADAQARQAPSVPAAEPQRVRVVIVGGGCAGLAAAWQLVKSNEAHAAERRSEGLDGLARLPGAERERLLTHYDVTVYESSWRLGGKGASVRDAHGRILEHGLHVWLGFYENAFSMMRWCYDAVERECWGPQEGATQPLTHGRFDDAFFPEPHIGVAARHGAGWEAWTAFLPPMKGEPGTPLDVQSNPFSAWAYLSRALALARSLLQSLVAPAMHDPRSDLPGPRDRSRLDEALELDFSFDPSASPEVLVDRFAVLTRAVLMTSAAGLLQVASFVENWLRERNPAPQIASSLLKLIEALATSTRRQLQDLVMVDEPMRRKTEILDLLMTIVIGLYRDRVFFDTDRGLDAIDGIDYRQWLEGHGASRGALDSPLVAGIYDLVFAYRDGDHSKPALSAAQALRGAMRMFFTYRGSMFWRMNSGMGDAVFAPLYKVLADKGVKFEFLHRLDRLTFDFEGRERRLKSLYFQPAGDPAAMRQCSPLDAHGCWPDGPQSCFGAAIESNSAGEVELHAEHEFEAAVLAVGLDDFVALAEPARLFEALPAFELMRSRVTTVATRSAQVWMSKSLDELGWDRGPVVLAGLDEPGRNGRPNASRPFETWADMTHTLAAERAWRARQAGGKTPKDPVRSVAYFCTVMRDGKQPAGAAQLRDFLAGHMRFFWPLAYVGKRTPVDLLVSAAGRSIGERQLPEQHISDNAEGSDRYTQALPGSGTVRISPLDPWFANLTFAGDWTNCGFNGGCVEAAVMSGMLAARAISGEPELNRIVGYHHP